MCARFAPEPEPLADIKGNKASRNAERNTKIVITEIYRAREVFRRNNKRSLPPMVINSLCFEELTAFSIDINKTLFRMSISEQHSADAD